MSMSLSQFRRDIFVWWKVLKDSEAVIEVHHRRKIYKIHVEPTSMKVTEPYKPRALKGVVPTGLIDTKPCKTCGNLLVNGVCMNRNCPSNGLKTAPEANEDN